MKALITSIALTLSISALAQETSIDTSTWFDDPATLTQTDGASIYAGVCAGCHMPNGQGANGAGKYPALTNNSSLMATAYPISLVIHGHKAMPPLGGVLDDEQVASVVNFIRTNFGNNYADNQASAELVKSMR
ncbi:cytochrome c [Halomonas sp. ISL-60]|uniref:c-type cytochrome n=1 Tax=Halomonas sp. ISL-56 TaxID=2819149 RepID=UPI001BEC2DB4|nr:cytochrome c [Halomonas sp. ISL-56]MBT2773041.1 cytochrome c [Halomonas sp. ISL-60]MBT2800457.1 cytochrome c [Halomonas sp. ISL-56]